MKLKTHHYLIAGAGVYLVWRLWQRGTLGQLVKGTAPSADQGNGTVTVNTVPAGFDVFFV
jgi:hypothetical protein